jgi:hypothetical protein
MTSRIHKNYVYLIRLRFKFSTELTSIQYIKTNEHISHPRSSHSPYVPYNSTKNQVQFVRDNIIKMHKNATIRSVMVHQTPIPTQTTAGVARSPCCFPPESYSYPPPPPQTVPATSINMHTLCVNKHRQAAFRVQLHRVLKVFRRFAKHCCCSLQSVCLWKRKTAQWPRVATRLTLHQPQKSNSRYTPNIAAYFNKTSVTGNIAHALYGSHRNSETPP